MMRADLRFGRAGCAAAWWKEHMADDQRDSFTETMGRRWVIIVSVLKLHKGADFRGGVRFSQPM